MRWGLFNSKESKVMTDKAKSVFIKAGYGATIILEDCESSADVFVHGEGAKVIDLGGNIHRPTKGC